MAIVWYYIGVLKNDFWNIVLEESKGLFADLRMSVSYIVLCVTFSLTTLVFVYLVEL